MKVLTYIHTYTHIRTTEAYLYYKLTNEPKDSGELKLQLLGVSSMVSRKFDKAFPCRIGLSRETFAFVNLGL